MEDLLFKSLVNDLSKLEEVEGILLGGSRGTNSHDEKSDYDVYIYTNKSIDLDIRKEITDKYCSYMELNNCYWEAEDDGILKNGIVLELIYRDFSIFNMIDEVCFNNKANNGYTTCFWYNILNSKVLYDKDGKLTSIIEKYKIPYPEELRLNIINKNFSLLKGFIPSYYDQIKKAVERNDYISINHRITEFLSSYFDIIFALNKTLHPGEKRLISYVLNKCSKIPNDFEVLLDKLIKSIGSNNEDILFTLDNIIENLKVTLVNEKLI